MKKITDLMGNDITIQYNYTENELKDTFENYNKTNKKIIPVNRNNLYKDEIKNFMEVSEILRDKPEILVTILDVLFSKHISGDYYFVGQSIPLAYVSNMYIDRISLNGNKSFKIPIVLELEIEKKNELSLKISEFAIVGEEYKDVLYSTVSTVNKILYNGLNKTNDIVKEKLDILTYKNIFYKDVGKLPKEFTKLNHVNLSNYRLKRPNISSNKIYNSQRTLSFRDKIKLNRFKKDGYDKVLLGDKDSKLYKEFYRNNILVSNITKHKLSIKEVDNNLYEVYYCNERYLYNNSLNKIEKG